MSIINKMLKDLDRRNAAPQWHASSGSGAVAGTRASEAMSARIGSELFWWIIVAALVFAIGWLGWVMWQLTPRPVVNELALRVPAKATSALGIAEAPTSSSNSADIDSLTDVGVTPALAPDKTASISPSLSGMKFDMLKLATEITTPIALHSRRAALPSVQTPPRVVSRGSAQTSQTISTAVTQAPAADAWKINKHVIVSARERAETEYRRAVALVDQRRLPEGIEALRGVLNVDAAYAPARQLLVAVLLDQRRVDEAAVLLERGLDIEPANGRFAMLLARIMVDRQDVAGAMALLQKHAPAGGGDSDYHAFVAALLQRLGRHAEAIREYQLALQPSPRTGVWWLGLAISQEASGTKEDAIEAFRRARATDSLGPDLQSYVDQRLRQLQ